VDVALARHCRSVAEVRADFGGQLLERQHPVRFGQQPQGEHARVPGAEVLGGEALAHRLAQVGVDVVRSDRVRLAGIVEVLEQMLPGQVLHHAHEARQPAVADRRFAHLPALGLEAQLERYPQLGNSVESILNFLGEEQIVDLARRFIMEKGVEVFNFGKHKGKSVSDVLKAEPQYYDWMMKGEFPLHTKQKLTEIFNRTMLKKG